jgi:hypothetical protein
MLREPSLRYFAPRIMQGCYFETEGDQPAIQTQTPICLHYGRQSIAAATEANSITQEWTSEVFAKT